MEDTYLSVDDARQNLLSAFQATEATTVPLLEALGLVVTQDIRSPFDYPRFDNSSMDGFAVKSRDVRDASTSKPVVLKVIGDMPAGESSDITLAEREAVRIMTGAMVPSGADCVVPVEFTNIDWQDPANRQFSEWIEVKKPVDPGAYIRKIGEDIQEGEVVLKARKLRPAEIGFLAMLGVSKVEVFRRPRVALFSSGDELIEPGQQLKDGKIFDANSYTLRSLIQQTGAECLWLGIVPDQEASVLNAFEAAVEAGVDMIISTAGVSVGVFDFIRIVLQESGKLHFWKVNMRPGKPLAFGEYKSIPFIGLPGNPVSAFVGFEVFVRPVIEKLLGSKGEPRNTILANLSESIESDGRESYLRGVVEKNGSGWLARLTGHQGSGNLHSLVEANALLIVPSGVKSLPVGAEIEAWLLEQ